jgi:hypothetical protein
MNIGTIFVWSAFAVANTINSRSRQSKSWRWNFYSSLVVGGLYAAMMVGLGDVVLHGKPGEIAVAIALYALSTAIGNVIGQEIVLQSRFFQEIEKS